MQEKEITHKGKTIFYRTIGEGPVVVLLHGVPFEGNLWINQFYAFPNYKLIIPDLPGSGHSQMIEDMSIEGMAECVKEIIVHESSGPHQTSPNGGGLANTQASLTQDSLKASEDVSVGEFYREADPVTYKLLKNFVSEHRRSPTKAEDFLWQQLRGNKLNGYSFRRQHIIGNFIVDFVCLAKKLIIEVDGLIHQLPENKISDEERASWLQMKGYSVIRFTNDEILFDLENSLNRIRQDLNDLPLAQRKIFETPEKENQQINKDFTTSEVGAVDSSSVGGNQRLGTQFGKGAIIIGHSMGGYVTLALAEKHPELLNGFGLFHSTAYTDSEEKKAMRRKTIEKIQMNGIRDFVNNSIPGLFSAATKTERPELIEEQINNSYNFLPEAIVYYQRAMMQRPDRTEVLKNSKVPVLFILGKYDTAVPLKDGLEQGSLADLTYIHVLENAGHLGMKEEPIESNIILLNYLTNTCHQTQ